MYEPHIKLGCIIYTNQPGGPCLIAHLGRQQNPPETRRCLTSVKIFLAKRFIKGAPQVRDAK